MPPADGHRGQVVAIHVGPLDGRRGSGLETVADSDARARPRELRRRNTSPVEDSANAEPVLADGDYLLGMLSHELRAPLAVIIGSAQLLNHHALVVEQGRELLADIEQEAHRLSAIIDDLRVFGGRDRAPQVLTEPILLQRLLPGIVARARFRFPAATIELDVPPSLPAVEADPTLCGQILINLLSNAAKYAGSAPRIRLRVEAAGGTLTIACEDDGPGFPPGALAHAFEAFYRAPSTARRAEGTGLGLYVVRRLAAAMGGDATCRNAPSGGAVITVRLPRALTDADSPPTRSSRGCVGPRCINTAARAMRDPGAGRSGPA